MNPGGDLGRRPGPWPEPVSYTHLDVYKRQGLLPPTARLSGRILFDGHDLLTMSPKEHNALRGHDMAMVYQDALSSLNPVSYTHLDVYKRQASTSPCCCATSGSWVASSRATWAPLAATRR